MENKRVCSVEGCNEIHCAKGLCKKHYAQFKRHGEISSRTIYDKNEIVVLDDCAEIILYDKNGKENARTLIDLNDIDKCKDIKWYLRKNYAHSRKVGPLHRFLLNPKENEVVDHINHNPLDNRKNNLRICTTQQNRMNTNKINKKTTSQYKGVYLDKRRNKWYAQIKINKKSKFLGSFDSEIEASINYDRAAILYFGVFANTNHPINNYTNYIIELGQNPEDYKIDIDSID